MRTFLAGGCGLWLLCGSISASAQPPPATNLELVQQLCREAARQAVASLDSAAAVVIVPAPATGASAERVLYQAVVEELQSMAVRHVYSAGDSARARVRVSFKLLRCELSYDKLRSGFLRRAKVRRQARLLVDFDVHFIGLGGSLFQGYVAPSRVDTVAHNVVPGLEDPALPFTTGNWQATEPSRNLLEPVLLTAATGAIIYAFYTLRSK